MDRSSNAVNICEVISFFFEYNYSPLDSGTLFWTMITERGDICWQTSRDALLDSILYTAAARIVIIDISNAQMDTDVRAEMLICDALAAT